MAKSVRKTTNQLRIIGGRWRGRKLSFPDTEQLRPTPDRVRETLFNWLQGSIAGAHCLDLFAGSGALGLEALSRGAASCHFVEQNPMATSTLWQNLALLAHISHPPSANSEKCEPAAENIRVIQANVAEYLCQPTVAYQLVFVDPPYGQDLLASTLSLLDKRQWLSPHALIYLEAESNLKTIDLPANWRLHRSKFAGDVGYHLAIFEPA